MNLVRILVGVVLLSALLGARTAHSQDWVYVAEPGDTLWDICLEYTIKRGCWIELGKYNDIPDPMRILPGTEIHVPLDWLAVLPVVGTVVEVRGEVRYQEQDGNNPIPLVAGEQLVLGSVITTLDGTARLQLSGNSEVFLRPQSVLELNRVVLREDRPGKTPGKTELTLDRGNAEIHVEPRSRSRFEVHTPSAIAAVRGTRYRVATASRTATRGEVLEGKVAIVADASVDVPGGYGLIAQQGVPLGEPRKLLDPPVFASNPMQGSLPLVVEWASDPLAVRWHLDVYSEAGGLISTEQTTQNRFTVEDWPLGCYRVVARAIDADGFNGMEGQASICVEPPAPPEPVPEEPQSTVKPVLWFLFAVIMLL